MQRSFVTIAPIALLLTAARAQCPTPPTAVALGSWCAPAGTVHALATWDPDGPGPLGNHVVCGGDFQFAGTAATANIALYDPIARTFAPLGAGFDGSVHALAVLANGALVAGGAFTASGTSAIARIARWTGTTWVPLGGGTDDAVLALAVMANGDVVAGGKFATAGGSLANGVARWNGLVWSGLGGGVGGTIPSTAPFPVPLVTQVTHLGVRPNGDIVAGGEFATAGGIPANGVAVWNGASWSSPVAGPTSNHVQALRVLANGDVLTSFGDLWSTWFTSRWNGVTWTPLGGNRPAPHTALGELANGSLVAAAYEPFGWLGQLETWNGASWLAVPTPSSGTGSALLEFTPGDVWMASVDDRGVMASIRRWNGVAWSLPAAGLDMPVDEAIPFGSGFAISGLFTQAGASAVGGVWSSGVALLSASGVATPIADLDGLADAMTIAANGDLVIGGFFTRVGSVPAQRAARFDGAQWHAMGSAPLAIAALAAQPNGDVLAAGYHIVSNNMMVAIWDGIAWTTVANIPTSGTLPFGVSSIAVLPNGDLVVGMVFTSGAKVLRWDGSAWSPLGNGLLSAGPYDSVDALCVLPNGDLVAGGRFVSGPLANVARWDGQNWQAMGTGLPSQVLDLDVLPGGGLLATHSNFDDSYQPVAAPSIWRGNVWTPLAEIEAASFHTVLRSAVHPLGGVLVAGSFQSVQGASAGGLALVNAGCPATTTVTGVGCTGSAGAVQLAVTSLAWLGDSYRARTTGLPANSIVIQAFGLAAAAVPLATVLPQALPGCTLHVSPDVLLLDAPTAGAVTATWALPTTASLLGQSFRQQTIPFELSLSGAVQAVSASNAVSVTIGAF